MSDKRFCKGCGKEIIWGVTAPGKAVPLDPRAPIYHVVPDTDAKSGYSAIKITRSEVDGFMVSHFSTCPHANDFSAGNRRQKWESQNISTNGETGRP